MTLNQLSTMIRKYRTYVAMAALLIFVALTVGVIYYIRSVQEPIAPTAPTSRPSAAQNACMTSFVINPGCQYLETEDEYVVGEEMSFVCAGLAGTNRYIFEYTVSPGGTYAVISDGPASSSASIEASDYLSVRCRTCADDFCESADQTPASCMLTFSQEVIPTPSPSPSPEVSPSPSPSPSPEVTPSPSPTPSVSPSPTPVAPQCNSQCVTTSDCPANMVCSSGRCRNPECTSASDCSCEEDEENPTGFYIEKFHDKDGDGSRDSGEEGLDWEFEWMRNDDQNWRQYQTYASQNGRGGNVADLSNNDKIRIREKSKSGWTATTDTERELIMRDEQILMAQFGNRQPTSSPQPASSPKPVTSPQPELPVSGSTAQTAGLLIVGIAIMLFGFARFVKR